MLTYLLSCTISEIFIAFDRSNIAIFGYPLLHLTRPRDGMVPWDDLRKIISRC